MNTRHIVYKYFHTLNNYVHFWKKIFKINLHVALLSSTYSASVQDRVTILCFLVHHVTKLQTTSNKYPLIDFLSYSFAQSASAYPMRGSVTFVLNALLFKIILHFVRKVPCSSITPKPVYCLFIFINIEKFECLWFMF